MKASIIFAIIIFSLNSCKKEQTASCFTVKYVDGFCYTHIYEIIDPAFQHLGHDNWIRQRDGKSFDNVFVLENFCENLSSSYNPTDSTYTVRLLTDNEPKNVSCIVCHAAYNSPPLKSLAVKASGCDE